MIQKVNKARWIYIIFGVLIMIFLGTVYSYGVFRIAIEQIFKVGSAESGIPYMTALAFYAIFMFLTGKYLNRFNPRYFIVIGGLLVATGWILSSFATSIMMLTITYGCVSGAGVGIAYGAPMTVVARWFPEKKGLAVGLVLMGFGLSPLVTAPFARILIDYYGLMNGFKILGVSFISLLPLLSFPFRYPKEVELVGLDQIRNKNNISLNVQLNEMIKTRSFKGIYLNYIIGTMIGLMLVGMTAKVGIDYIGMEPGRVTQWIAVFAIFNGLGRPIYGWITDRLTPSKVMLLSYAMIILSAVVLIIWGEYNQYVYICTFSVFWFNLGGWLAIVPASVLRLYGSVNYSQNYGLVFTAYGIGAIAGVSTSGMLLDKYDNYQYILYYVIGLCVVGVLLNLKFLSNKNVKLVI